MRAMLSVCAVVCSVAVGGCLSSPPPQSVLDRAPAVGKAAPDFELPILGGGKLKLSEQLRDGPVVLVILRGYPGYQCVLCSRQVGDFLSRADDFRSVGARVVWVYPGPAAQIEAKAREFVENRTFPEHFVLVTDGGLQMVSAYGLRWNSGNETAYPSTFVIDRDGKIRFTKICGGYGGRPDAAEVLESLTDQR